MNPDILIGGLVVLLFVLNQNKSAANTSAGNGASTANANTAAQAQTNNLLNNILQTLNNPKPTSSGGGGSKGGGSPMGGGSPAPSGKPSAAKSAPP
jgi:hypothetical protein